MAETVWLARHGNRQDFVDPEWRKTAARPYDPGLSHDGEVQAQQLAQRMSREHISFVFASPFLRTIQTANYVAEALDVPIYVEPGIAEWMNPEWFPREPETLSIEELAERYPRINKKYTACRFPSFPETEGEAMTRAGIVARNLADAFPRPIILVGHGVSVAGAATGLAGNVTFQECALCSLYKIVRLEGGWQMTLCGDVSHLKNGSAGDRFAP